ncbi:MAG: AAA family ATPase [Deltaproteobacteria bacterium]|nr:AAA family ATPase [Deltaproteobacteria bacterium]
MKLSKLEVLVNFGFCQDPFDGPAFETADQIRIRRIIGLAVRSRAMVSIIGERGIGKSEAVKAALDALNARLVMVRPADKERLLISDIEQEMIYALGDDPPRRGKVVRTEQLRRTVGDASRKQEVVLVIEEAHRLHGQTLRSLKTLRELDWLGKSKLFSVILVGQSDPTNKPGVAEVRLRTDSVSMHGLSEKEAGHYLQMTVGAVFSDEAAAEVARQPGASNFLDLQQLLINSMGRALAAGRERVEAEDICENKTQKRTLPARKVGPPAKKDMSEAVRSVLSKRNGEAQPPAAQAAG